MVWYYIAKAIRTKRIVLRTHQYKVFKAYVDCIKFPQGLIFSMEEGHAANYGR